MIRSLARQIAKKKMRGIGMVKLCKNGGSRRNGKRYFAAHWREFV